MGEGWYRLRKSDALHLGDIIEAMRSDTLARHGHMLLYCWSQMQARGDPCPHFTLGIRRIADECGVPKSSAHRFVAKMERDGWMVRVGEAKSGRLRFPKRTFWWVAEEHGATPPDPSHVSRVGGTGQIKTPGESGTGKAQNAGKSGTHTESRALRDSGSAALDDSSGRPHQSVADASEYFRIRPLRAMRDPGGGGDEG